MARLMLVVEVLDPVSGLTNVYFNADEDPSRVACAMASLDADGVKPTGTYSWVERGPDGMDRRIDGPMPIPLFVKGWRTRAAFLRA